MVKHLHSAIDPPAPDSDLPDVSGLSAERSPRAPRRAADRDFARRLSGGEVRKQISLFLGLSDWRRLRAHAAQRHQPLTQVVHEQLAPLLGQLRASEGISTGD